MLLFNNSVPTLNGSSGMIWMRIRNSEFGSQILDSLSESSEPQNERPIQMKTKSFQFHCNCYEAVH